MVRHFRDLLATVYITGCSGRELQLTMLVLRRICKGSAAKENIL